MSGVVVFGLGTLVGAIAALWLLVRWSQSDAANREMAMARAEQRAQEVQLAALTRMTAVVESTIQSPARRASTDWPSERDRGVVVVETADGRPVRRSA